jgi:ABC-type multidrug transport system fused ATPase/permease subunit
MHTLSAGIGGLKAARLLHQSLLNNVVHLPVSTFFDVTPIGRILARFSSDVNVVDTVLPHLFHMWLPNLFRVSKLIPVLFVMIVKTVVIKCFCGAALGEGTICGLGMDL